MFVAVNLTANAKTLPPPGKHLSSTVNGLKAGLSDKYEQRYETYQVRQRRQQPFSSAKAHKGEELSRISCPTRFEWLFCGQPAARNTKTGKAANSENSVAQHFYLYVFGPHNLFCSPSLSHPAQ
jgi:hypothetical protein